MDFGLSWMAWTLPTAAFFVFIGLSIAAMGVWEYFSPGGAPRRGIFGIDTTRGDRLFITLLGSAFIFLGWLGIFGAPLWAPLGIAIVWAIVVFLWV
jgi:predicted small integral membrane protein